MKKEQTGTKSLKWFLIKRFLIIMLFIFISEELLNMAYRLWVVPFLADTMHISQISVTAANGNMMPLMLRMFLLSGASMFPEPAARWVQMLIGRNMETGLGIALTSPVLEGVSSPMLIHIYQLAVIIIFFGLFFVTLIPYLISGYWYYRAVSKKVKELLLEEKAQKEAFDKKRNLLLSDIAHDIKTPLTTVSGYAKALADDMVAEESKRKEYLQAIVAKSMRMDELITLLFEYVKLDSSGFSLHKKKADLGELLRKNIALLYADFEEKGIELEIEIPEEIGQPFDMDIVQMGRAVGNILTNSVKYNEKGTKVHVSLRTGPGGRYQIRIADNGGPIEDDLAGHIFEPFSRGDQTRNTGGGSGLGLSISYKIVQMHGGELWLDRECKGGFTKAFVISL